jgi:calmodulin-regulated spectrin-associated protein
VQKSRAPKLAGNTDVQPEDSGKDDKKKRPMSTGRMRGKPEADQLHIDHSNLAPGPESSRYETPRSVGSVSTAGTNRVPPAAPPVLPYESGATPKPRAQSAGKVRSEHSRGDAALAPSNYRAAGKAMSNMQQVKNALSNVCLAGGHFALQRDEALKAIDLYHSGQASLLEIRDNAPVAQFVILFFHAKSFSYRGVYGVDPQTGDMVRMVGKGPRILPEQLIEEYLKYETSSRSFKPLPTKSLTATTDAVALDPAKLKKLMHGAEK